MDHFFTSSMFYFIGRTTQLSYFSDCKSSFICTATKNAFHPGSSVLVFHFFHHLYYYIFFSIQECTWSVPSHLEWRSPWRSGGAQSTMGNFLSYTSIARIQIEVIYQRNLPKASFERTCTKIFITFLLFSWGYSLISVSWEYFSIKTEQSTLWKQGLDAWGRNPTKTCIYYDILFLERSWEIGYKWPEKMYFLTLIRSKSYHHFTFESYHKQIFRK